MVLRLEVEIKQIETEMSHMKLLLQIIVIMTFETKS